MERLNVVSQSEFISFIASLAPESETALVVRQVPIKRKGVQLTHLDGTPRYTWPAALPCAKLKPRQAVYCNTGSFIPERFNGTPSASKANIDYVLCMMLDDIGTKAKAPPLDPTWIIETSPGSFQWGYVFREQPSKQNYEAAHRAIAAAGYSDAGVSTATRNFRVPGSVNLKPGRGEFQAAIVSFNPERDFTLGEICTALNVTPENADTASHKSIKVSDTNGDNVFAWLNEIGLVLAPPNAEGWAGVICPNNGAHSDGNPEGRYNPVNRAYCCWHEHCAELNSTTFLQWVAANGGPEAQQGLRDELLTERMQLVAETAEPSDMFTQQAEAAIARVNATEAARVERRDWHNRFAYIKADDSYFDLVTRAEYTRGNFNAVFRHVECRSVHNLKRRIEASHYYDEMRVAQGGRVLASITYASGEPALLERDGLLYGNKWIDARPAIKKSPKDRPIDIWLEHCRDLVPETFELEHCFNVMAFKVQNPKVKVNHAILHGSDEGVGKDTMWAPFIWAVCGQYGRNRAVVEKVQLNSQWGYAHESEIIVLNELRQDDAGDRRGLANQLKSMLAAPPDTLPVNRKGLHPYEAMNRLQVIAFTNSPVPIVLPSQDRRWFCIWSHNARMDEAKAVKLWRWYADGGYEAVAAWLHNRDVSLFNPAATPPITDAKQNMIEDGMSASESFLVDAILTRRHEFKTGAIRAPFVGILASLQNAGLARVTSAALLVALKEAGWKDCGRIASRAHPNKVRVFCAPDVFTLAKSEIMQRALDADNASVFQGFPKAVA